MDSLVSIGWVVSDETSGLGYGTLLAFLALLGMPVIGLVVGFVWGFAESGMYVIFARWFPDFCIHFFDS